MSDQKPPESRGPILPSLAVALGSWYLGAMLALNADNPSMFQRFLMSVGAGVGLMVLTYLGRQRR